MLVTMLDYLALGLGAVLIGLGVQVMTRHWGRRRRTRRR